MASLAAIEPKSPKMRAPKRMARRQLPGFGLTLGYTMVYLSLLVLIPLSAVFIRSFGLGWGHFWDVVTAPRVMASLRLSFGASLIAALINVVFGTMSLVGPRPERPEYVVRFARDVARYEDRHRVKSGITGWAQVHGYRGQTSIADRVEWDNYYIQNWSIWLDLRIIFMTIAEVLRFRG